MYRTVLLLTDGSEAAAAALDDAVEIAARFDATLHALFIADTSLPFTGAPTGEEFWETVMERIEAEGERAVGEIARSAEDRGVSVVTEVRRAPAVHAGIDDYVAEVEPDVVVMGTHGRTGWRRFMLGSVTDRVLRTARVPVVVVPEPPAER